MLHILWIDDAIREDSTDIRLLRLAGITIDESGLDALQRLIAAGDYRVKPLEASEIASLLHRLGARAPSMQAVSAPLPEIEWVHAHASRLAASGTHAELVTQMLRTLLERRITLRLFFGCAAALKLALTDPDAPVTALGARMRSTILQAVEHPLPRHPKLRAALAALEREGDRQAPQQLALRIGLSRAYFSRMIFKHTGRHYSEWCRAALMRTAMRQVCESTERISQIAYAAGYEHAGQFNRDFAGAFGASPTRLRHLFLHCSR